MAVTLVSPQISAQRVTADTCDAKILDYYLAPECDSSNYSEPIAVAADCRSKCAEVKNDAEQCCYWKCFLDQFQFRDGVINRTAFARIYNPIVDPQIVQNVGKCEALGKFSRHQFLIA